jgi:hypothetical protein
MKNLVFFLALNLLVNYAFSSNFPYKYHSINEIEFTKIESKNTLKKLFEKEINTYAFDTKNLIINHCKLIFNKNNNSAINDITIGLTFTLSIGERFFIVLWSHPLP